MNILINFAYAIFLLEKYFPRKKNHACLIQFYGVSNTTLDY